MAGALLALAAACGAPAQPAITGAPRALPAARPPISRQATVEELVRMRCALDGRDVFTTWSGAVFAFVPGERPRRLFDVVGVNVARCLRGDRWRLTSRELMYYLDPADGRMLARWTNPWTSESVPVIHVANRLVQSPLGPAPMTVADGTATIAIDVPVFYPNPLAADEATRAYSPEPSYQAGEFFTLAAPAAAVEDPALPSVPSMALTWHRVGPWLPWMKMNREGRLVYTAHGRKAAGLHELPPLLQREIAERMPLYRAAPVCVVQRPNVTSWTYFAAHADRYRAGASFPVPEPADPAECPVPGQADR